MISSRTLIDAHWGSGSADWGHFDVQNGAVLVGPSLIADRAHHILYVADPAHALLRAYDDQTGKELPSDEAPIEASSSEGAASPTSGDVYVLSWVGSLERIVAGRVVSTVHTAAPVVEVGRVSGPLAVTRDDTVWVETRDGWLALARRGEALPAGEKGGTPPPTDARLVGTKLVLGSGTAQRTVALPISALPAPTAPPNSVFLAWSARAAESGVVWAVVSDQSRRSAPQLTLVEVTAAGKVRSRRLPSPPDNASGPTNTAPDPFALTSAGVAVLSRNDPRITLYAAG